MATPKNKIKTRYSNILVAVDGSVFSEKAASAAVQLAQSMKASLSFLCVVDISNIPNSAATGGVIDAEVLKIYHEEAQKIIDRLLKKYPYPKVQRLIVEGIPTDTIIRAAKGAKANIIVTGTHGRTGLSHLLSGSVAEHVIRHSTIPVLVVPGPKKK
jgi:nucleotide-binding universal stress UspA family protein